MQCMYCPTFLQLCISLLRAAYLTPAGGRVAAARYHRDSLGAHLACNPPLLSPPTRGEGVPEWSKDRAE